MEIYIVVHDYLEDDYWNSEILMVFDNEEAALKCKEAKIKKLEEKISYNESIDNHVRAEKLRNHSYCVVSRPILHKCIYEG